MTYSPTHTGRLRRRVRCAAEDARGEQAYTPAARDRAVSTALRAYGLLATAALQGAVRDLRQVRPAR